MITDPEEMRRMAARSRRPPDDVAAAAVQAERDRWDRMSRPARALQWAWWRFRAWWRKG